MTRDLLDPVFLARLKRLRVASKVIVNSLLRGEHRSRVKGVSMEFADYKDYIKGDELKHLDWNAYARLDRLFIKTFEEERDLTLHVLLDTSGSMGHGEGTSKLDYGTHIAAALSYISLANLDRAGVTAIGDGIGTGVAPRRGRAQILTILDMLNRVEADGRTDLDHCLTRYAQLTKRSGLVVLISDLLDPAGLEKGLARLRYRKNDVIVFHLLSPEERTLPVRGDVAVVDCETGERREVSVNRHMAAIYSHAVEGFCHRMKDMCTSVGAQYVGVDTSVPFERAIIAYLVRRRMLR